MVSGQSEWNSSSEANFLSKNFHSGCDKKKVSDSFTLTDNSPVLEIDKKISKQNQLLLNNYTPQQTDACFGTIQFITCIYPT